MGRNKLRKSLRNLTVVGWTKSEKPLMDERKAMIVVKCALIELTEKHCILDSNR